MSLAIEVRGLRRVFRSRTGMFGADRAVRAVDGVSFSLAAGDVLGIVGESGCGKSTLGRLIMGLLPSTEGEVLVDGQRLADLDRRARARLIQPVFQDPFSSLNPRQRVGEIVGLPLAAQGALNASKRRERVAEMPAPGWARPGDRDAVAGATIRRPSVSGSPSRAP